MWGCIPDTSGERLHGMQEVRGSIPLISTKTARKLALTADLRAFLFPLEWGRSTESDENVREKDGSNHSAGNFAYIGYDR